MLLNRKLVFQIWVIHNSGLTLTQPEKSGKNVVWRCRPSIIYLIHLQIDIRFGKIKSDKNGNITISIILFRPCPLCNKRIARGLPDFVSPPSLKRWRVETEMEGRNRGSKWRVEIKLNEATRGVSAVYHDYWKTSQSLIVINGCQIFLAVTAMLFQHISHSQKYLANKWDDVTIFSDAVSQGSKLSYGALFVAKANPGWTTGRSNTKTSHCEIIVTTVSYPCAYDSYSILIRATTF